ncbi:MAG: hypothetical protein D6767_09825 [Candidatus Hydrogenedentota bacterium]|nr:MAG: hypothetical protein D6767_09825 [Candidatus Hydrogenedentota bacterium]
MLKLEKVRRIWAGFVTISTIFLAIELPIRIAFRLESLQHIYMFEIFWTVLYTIDIFVKFVTPIKIKFQIITDKKEIAKHYLRKWFWVDLLSAFPWFIIFGPFYGSLLRGVRFFYFFRFHKATRSPRFTLALQKWLPLSLLKPGIIRLSFFVFGLSLLAHWIACGWVLLGHSSGQILLDYGNAIYWTITTLTTVGYGDITPTMLTQKYYTMFVMLIGVASYGYVIGNLASLLANMDMVREKHLEKLDRIQAFLQYRGIPKEMQERIFSYYEHVWEHHLDISETDILEELPRSLRTDLSVFLYGDILAKVPFFRDANPDLIRDIVTHLKPTVIPPNTTFIQYGEIGDRMFFISYGEVEVFNEDFTIKYGTLREGDFVGEMALILNEPRNANVRTVGYCDLYQLKQEDFKRIITKHPEFQKHIKEVMRTRKHS